MDRDTVIRLAREAGLNVVSFYDGDEVFEGSNTYFKQTNLIEHFAALVAAHERERICKQIAMLHDSLSLTGTTNWGKK